MDGPFIDPREAQLEDGQGGRARLFESWGLLLASTPLLLNTHTTFFDFPIREGFCIWETILSGERVSRGLARAIDPPFDGV